MNELTVNYEEQTISARELHESLNIKTAFKDWFPRMCEYGFVEGRDFCSKMSESTGGRPSKDYDIKIDMAKEICMIQRTPEGKKVREYLIDLEKAWNTPELIMARALKLADKQITGLKEENSKLIACNNTLSVENSHLYEKIEKDRPAVEFAEAVKASSGCIHVGNFAKIIGVGPNVFWKWLRKEGYVGNKKGTSNYNIPLQRYLSMGLFELKPNLGRDDNGNPVTYPPTALLTGKGQTYFQRKWNETHQEHFNQLELFG